MSKYNLFTKIVVLIVIMLIPILILYVYSNRTTTGVLRDELNTSNMNQLVFFQQQVNTSIDLLSSWPNLLINDPDILSFNDSDLQGGYLNLDGINLVKRIQTKLSIQESSSNWKSRLTIYSPSLHRMVSSNASERYKDADLEQTVKPGWQVRKAGTADGERFVFSWVSVSPYTLTPRPREAAMIIKVEFDSRNIEDMLDKFKSDGRREPFYYKKDTGKIYNRTANRPLTEELIKRLEQEELKDIEIRTVEVRGQPYTVGIVRSDTIGWYLIDYMPLSDILQPIHRSNRLFYTSIACLLLMSCLAAYLLYVQVQVPVKQLIAGFQRLKHGDYSVRVKPKGRNEFSFLSVRFNLMVGQIQELFEKVYMEKIHVREARLKQLQSQINPHFFYNCFSFITSMAKLQNVQAVIAMSHNLSRYYRYTTRQERDLVPLSEETEFVTNYLEIQKMRMNRLHYTVEIPPPMRKLNIPPLVIQPLVENAVLHGIEPHRNASTIRVTGEYGGGMAKIVVEDDGGGLTMGELAALETKLSRPLDEEMGCGLWNVNQRMRLRFGEEAGLLFSVSPLGGLKVTLQWPLAAGS